MVVDVGAGIGRVSKGLLLKFFQRVSLLEANETFLNVALTQTIPPSGIAKVYNVRFGNWNHDDDDLLYDLVWIQWVIIYASDTELVAFLRQAALSLKTGGLIGVKDNFLSPATPQSMFDEEDHSVCRTTDHFELLIAQAGLKILEKRQQEGFPPGLFPVWMFMLQPLNSA